MCAVCQYLVRSGMQEETNISALANGLTYKRGTDFEHGSLQEMHVVRQILFFYGVIGTRVNIDTEMLEYLFRLMPEREELPVVRPDDECKLVLRIGFCQSGQCVGGVRRTRKSELEIGCVQLGIVFDGGTHQTESECIVPKFALVFQRIARRYHEPYFVQVRELAEIVGKCQMPDVYRIERATEYPYFPLRFFHCLIL